MTSKFLNDLRSIACKLPAEKLDGKSILITGASGLIGSAVAKMLLSSEINVDIYVASRDNDKLVSVYADYLSDCRLHFIVFDVTEPINLNLTINYILDCASQGNPKAFKNTPVDVIKANVLGVCNLMEFGLRTGIERMVYVSSGEVYGEGNEKDFVEEYSGYINPCDVRSCYPASKRAAESLCVSYGVQYAADTCIVRPCHIYGPNYSKSDDRAFVQFFNDVKSGKDIVLKSLGTQVRSWLYVVDCAYAIIHVLLYGAKSTAYNIASYDSVASIREFASVVAGTKGKNIVFNIPEGKDRNAIISRGVLNPTRLYQLGWNPTFSLEEGISHSIESL